MKIVVDAFRDDEAKVWVAEARDNIGLVTEAATIEELQRRLVLVVPDLVDDLEGELFQIELVARNTLIVAA